MNLDPARSPPSGRDARGWSCAAIVIATATLAGAGLAQDVPIKALRWMTPSADRARLLTTEPAECLQISTDPAQTRAVEIGRAVFRSPLLLGGQAARAGLTCESCHRGGRGNPQFQFAGVSGPPGTADVTSSLFSSHRGDGADNPVPIPDLAGPRDRLKVAPEALPGFVRGLIVEEFDGPEPTPAVLAGVVAYVRALSPAACPAQSERVVTLAVIMEDARRALAAAQTAPDPATAAAMVAAARARLGLINERYAARALAAERRALRAADRTLADLAQAIRLRAPDSQARLRRAVRDSHALEARLHHREAESLFDFNRLAAAT